MNQSYSIPKKPQFYPQVNQTTTQDQSKYQSQSQQNLNHSKPAAPSTKQLQMNNKYQMPNTKLQYQHSFQTPTQQVQVPKAKVIAKSKSQKITQKREFTFSCRILEAKLLVNLAKVFSMNVHCTVSIKDEVKKTSSQSGQNPKWNESFQFDIKDEKKQNHVEFTVYHKALLFSEEKIGKTIFFLHDLSQFQYTEWFILKNDKDEVVGSILIYMTVEEKDKKKQSQSEEDEENLIQDPQSVDYSRDQEISINQTTKQQKLRATGQNERSYQVLQTQQQIPNSSVYLNTQVNQPRQSVTEHSMVQLISTHSSNNSGAANQHSGSKPQIIRMNHQNNLIDDDAGQLIPQQLLFGKNIHSSSSNNLMGVAQKIKNHQQQQQISNSQYLAFEDLSTNMGAGGMPIMNQSQYNQYQSHHKHHHHKKRKRRKEKEIEDEMIQIQGVDTLEEQNIDEGNHLNLRNQQQFYLSQPPNQPISSQNSQQLLHSSNKQGFESGGGGSGSGSGGIQQLYNGNFNIGQGSNGSYMPVPSYFEEQHSIESLTDNQNALLAQLSQNQQIELLDFQDLEQIQLDLKEENLRIKAQENKLRALFERFKLESMQLKQERQEIKKIKEKLRYEAQMIKSQKIEFDYQKQQLEKRYQQFKQEKKQRTQEVKILEELFKKFKESIQKAKFIGTQQDSQAKINELVSLMKNMNFGIQSLLANQINEARSQSRLDLNSIHQQQDSASSYGASSTGNYNFFMQGGIFPHSKGLAYSPINQDQSAKKISSYQGMVQGTNQINNEIKRNYSKNKINPDSSPPNIITDILNADEDEELVNNDHMLKLSRQQKDMIQNQNNNNFYLEESGKESEDFDDDFRTNLQSKQKNNHFFPQQQHELSTIIERELPSQRRSSNGGQGPNTTMEGKLDIKVGSTANQANNIIETQEFQIVQDEQIKQVGKQQLDIEKIELQKIKESLVQKQAMFDQSLTFYIKERQILEEQKKEQDEKQKQFESLFSKLQRELEDFQKIKEGVINEFQIQQQQQYKIDHNQDIVHITASDFKSTPLNQDLQTKCQNEFYQNQEEEKSENKHDESFDFVPDPNFLKKINQNMINNDQGFGEKGEKVINNKNIIPIQLEDNRANIIEKEINNLNFYGNFYQEDESVDSENFNQELDNYRQKLTGEQELEISRNTQGQGDRRVQIIQDEFGLDEDEDFDNNEDNLVKSNNDEQENHSQQDGYQNFLPDNSDEEEEEELKGTIKRNNEFQFQEKEGEGNGNQNRKKDKLPEEEIQRLINEQYHFEESNKDLSVIYKDNRVYDQPKKAVYGIQKINAEF